MYQRLPGSVLIRRAERWLRTGLSPGARLGLGLALFLFATVTALLISRIPLRSLPEYQVGDIARTEISTPVELIVVDPERTRRLRQEIADKVPPIFLYNPSVVEEVVEQLRRTFERTRLAFLDALESTFGRRSLTARETASRSFRRFLRSFQAEHTSFPVSLALAQAWARGESGQDVGDHLTVKLRGMMGHYIRPDALPPDIPVAPSRVRVLPVVDGQVLPSLERIEQGPLVGWDALYPLSQARAELLKSLAPDERSYGAFLTALMKPNCTYAAELTQRVRAQRTNQITATQRYAPRQVIVQRGQTITPLVKAAIDQLRAQTASKRSGRRFAGLLAISFILFMTLWRFAKRTRIYSLTPTKIFLLVGLAVTLQVAVIRLGIELSDIVGYRFFGDIDSPQAYQYAIPFAAVALVVVLLLEARIAVVVGLVASLFTLLLTEDATLTTYAAVSSVVAVHGVGRYQQRGALTNVGMMVGGVNALMAVILMMVNIQPLVLGPVLFSMGFGFMGGIFAAALASFMLPLGESLFDIPTDVKLLELSNAELPLLKRLAIEAPGTYQHSFIVATLAEAAAKAVGANSLLVRIGSYYHDIGKLSNPQMYVENQRRHFNPHELLTPEESAKVIIRHVTEGIRMAEAAGLPRPVIDLIPQHHGTRRLHYFYVKAKRLAEAKGEQVDERLFRYPGPKPRSIEAAIVMMADSAEASTRSLREPTVENIERLVNKVIDSIVTDGQLDECNLRMRDVKIIKSSFIDTLSNLHHHRIQYPGFTERDLAPLPSADYEAVWIEPTGETSTQDSSPSPGSN